MTFVGRGGLVAALAFLSSATVAFAETPAMFKSLSGSWRGSGDLQLADGGRERISCRAYYRLTGNGLGIAILCDSPNYKIEVRSDLTGSENSVSGQWEERTFHANGNLSGRVADNKIRLSISGYITGSMTVALNGRQQSVNITAQGTGFKSVSMSLTPG